MDEKIDTGYITSLYLEKKTKKQTIVERQIRVCVEPLDRPGDFSGNVKH